MAGETDLGVTVLEMTAGVDEGPVGARRAVPVPRDATAGRAYELLADAAVDALLDPLTACATAAWSGARRRARPRTGQIGAADKTIDWRRPAAAIADQVRALSPHIGAATELLGRRTRIWRAVPGAGPLPEGGGERLIMPPARVGWRSWSCSRRAGDA